MPRSLQRRSESRWPPRRRSRSTPAGSAGSLDARHSRRFMYRVFRPTATSKCMKKRPSACSDSSRVRLCAPRWGEEGPIWLEFNQATRGRRRNAQDWPRVVESDARHGRYRNTLLHEGPEQLSLALVAVPERQWTDRSPGLLHRPHLLRLGLRRGVGACVSPMDDVVTVSRIRVPTHIGPLMSCIVSGNLVFSCFTRSFVHVCFLSQWRQCRWRPSLQSHRLGQLRLLPPCQGRRPRLLPWELCDAHCNRQCSPKLLRARLLADELPRRLRRSGLLPSQLRLAGRQEHADRAALLHYLRPRLPARRNELFPRHRAL